MKLKKSLYIAAVALVSLTMTSCGLDSPAQSSMEESQVFVNEELVNQVVMGLHQSFAETNSYRGRYIPYFGINNDAEIFNGITGKDENDKEGSLAAYNALPTNSYMNTDNNAWGKLYEAIERANKAISGMEEYSDLDNASTTMRNLYGELLTLRSMIYYDLVKAWGDVPARWEPVTSETMYAERTDMGEVLLHIIDDLKTAEGYLGWPNENSYTTSTERVSKTFAKGLRARAALLAAGYSANKDNSGLHYTLSDEAKRKEMYQIALDECKDIIASGKSTLTSDFKTIWTDLCSEKNEAGKESIYEIPFSSGRGRVIATWGVKHADNDYWTSYAKGGANGPAPTLWYDYDKDDSRRAVTCVPYQWKEGLKTVSSTSGGGWCFGKVRFEWLYTYGGRKVSSDNDDGMNWLVMRLGDIYMMAAEAANYLNGADDAKQYINPILTRAYGSTAKADACTNSDDFFKLIVDERKLEFAGEALRKVDLMRWGLLKDALDDAKKKATALANREKYTSKFNSCQTYAYNTLPSKVYYDEGCGYGAQDADGYDIYGLEYGQTDTEGKALGRANSSRLFQLYTGDDLTGDKAKDNTAYNTSLNNLINRLYKSGNDPNKHMFWPIWSVFINNSNGTLVNYYCY